MTDDAHDMGLVACVVDGVAQRLAVDGQRLVGRAVLVVPALERNINSWNRASRSGLTISTTTSDSATARASTPTRLVHDTSYHGNAGLTRLGGNTLKILNHPAGTDPPCDEIGVDDVVMEAGGLERRVRALRLATENPCREMNETVEAGRGLRDCPGRP